LNLLFTVQLFSAAHSQLLTVFLNKQQIHVHYISVQVMITFYLIILFNLIIPMLLSLVGGTLSGNGCGSPNHT